MELNFKTTEEVITKVFKTEGYWIHTNHGKLLDTLLGSMSFIYGYDNDFILNRMYEQQKQLAYLNFKHNEICEANDKLVELLCEEGKFKGVSYAISGTDGVECAVAMNMHYWKNVDPTRTTIASFAPGYHGATYLCRAFRGEEVLANVKVLKAPEWWRIEERPSHEIKAFRYVKQLLETDKTVGAIIMESIPWSEGIKPWSSEWWKDMRQICTEYGVNLIIDDVMGGMGKLGYRFSHDRYGIQPDIVALGKAITGGFSPLSCACAVDRISDVIKDNWNYGHTWQPNMAGIGAALAVWEIFDSDKILDIENKLNILGKKLKTMGLVRNVVVIGLIFSYKLFKPISADSYVTHGLTGGPDIKYSISGCAPAIADDEYFKELETRIINALTAD
jgi:adenosylmethionine-8-amino-7-oxononanoate aminotransferase